MTYFKLFSWMTCFSLSPVLAITRLHSIMQLHFTLYWHNQVADSDYKRSHLNGEVKQRWSKRWEWTRETSIYLSSQGSESCHTWGSTCQPVPFGEWLLIRGQIKTQRQTLHTSWLNCSLEDYLALGRLHGLMWNLTPNHCFYPEMLY